MERRVCQNSGLTLPVLGIGCWSFGGGEYWGPQDQQEVNAIVNTALDEGINFFDTAEGYNEGRSEEALGVALKGHRQSALIGTKIPPSYTQPAVLREHCEASLRRLQTETIDLYMVHWPITDQSVSLAFDTLRQLQSEGKIRSVGVSNFGVRQLNEAVATGCRIEVNQLCYNLLSRGIEVELMPLCAGLGIGILAYMPLMQGLLSAKYASADEAPAPRLRTRHFRGDRPGSRHGGPGAEKETFAVIQAVREIAGDLGVPASHVALSWILSRPQITSILTGIRTVKQLGENAAGASYRLPDEIVTRLDALSEPLIQQLGSAPDYFESVENSRSF
jgi:aryl-alcohol dehydrogenase-like predicted oxidoreductase